MKSVGMLWVKLHIGNTKAVASLKQQSWGIHLIDWGVRHGCILTPYLFLIVGEVLNYIINSFLSLRLGLGGDFAMGQDTLI